MTLQLHRRDHKGDLEVRTVEDRDWRHELRSPRWGSRLKGGRLPGLANVEMNPTSRARSAAFWLGLAALTFVLLVAGYGSGFWH